jgi:hypothetical protein
MWKNRQNGARAHIVETCMAEYKTTFITNFERLSWNTLLVNPILLSPAKFSMARAMKWHTSQLTPD